MKNINCDYINLMLGCYEKPIDLVIIQYLIMGYSYNLISKKIYKSRWYVNKRLNRMENIYKFYKKGKR